MSRETKDQHNEPTHGLFSSDMLGVVWLSCAVKNLKDKHCHETPFVWVTMDGERISLCQKCYHNIQDGYYGEKTVENPVRIALLNHKD